MRPHLIYPDADVDFGEQLPVHVEEITDDLELETVLAAMSDGDQVIHDVSRHVLLGCTTDVDVVGYRQAVIADCAKHEDTIREL